MELACICAPVAIHKTRRTFSIFRFIGMPVYFDCAIRLATVDRPSRARRK
jgi:hypothetical protein